MFSISEKEHSILVKRVRVERKEGGYRAEPKKEREIKPRKLSNANHLNNESGMFESRSVKIRQDDLLPIRPLLVIEIEMLGMI